MEHSVLIEHEFVKKLGGIYKELKIRVVYSTEANFIGPDPSHVVSQREKYVHDILNTMRAINSTYEQLSFVPVFIRNYPDIEEYSKAGITRLGYLRYHIENHILKMSTLLDQSVILINQVFRLGIPSRDTSVRQLKTNLHTKSSDSVKLVADFDKTIRDIKHLRNKIIHKGEFHDGDFHQLEVFEMINSVAYDLMDSDDELYSNRTQDENEETKVTMTSGMIEKIEEYVVAVTEQMIDSHSGAGREIERLFTLLQIEFDLIVNKLDN